MQLIFCHVYKGKTREGKEEDKACLDSISCWHHHCIGRQPTLLLSEAWTFSVLWYCAPDGPLDLWSCALAVKTQVSECQTHCTLISLSWKSSCLSLVLLAWHWQVFFWNSNGWDHPPLYGCIGSLSHWLLGKRKHFSFTFPTKTWQ